MCRRSDDAFAALIREHAPAVLNLCAALVGREDGRDACQESLERIVENAPRFDPLRGQFRPWALAIGRNVCRDRLRRKGLERQAFLDDGDDVVDLAQARCPDPESTALARADAHAVQHALGTLPAAMRTALVLFHMHDATYEEISEALGVPMGTVMTWLHRGRKRLRDALVPREN